MVLYSQSGVLPAVERVATTLLGVAEPEVASEVLASRKY
jgi:hypothetical protein